RLTRLEEGTQYYGFFPGNYSFLYSYFENSFVDLNTKKMIFDNPDMVQEFQILKDAFDLQAIDYSTYSHAHTWFHKDRTLAMYPFHFSLTRLEAAAEEGDQLDWYDIAQTPTINGFSRS